MKTAKRCAQGSSKESEPGQVVGGANRVSKATKSRWCEVVGEGQHALGQQEAIAIEFDEFRQRRGRVLPDVSVIVQVIDVRLRCILPGSSPSLHGVLICPGLESSLIRCLVIDGNIDDSNRTTDITQSVQPLPQRVVVHVPFSNDIYVKTIEVFGQMNNEGQHDTLQSGKVAGSEQGGNGDHQQVVCTTRKRRSGRFVSTSRPWVLPYDCRSCRRGPSANGTMLAGEVEVSEDSEDS